MEDRAGSLLALTEEAPADIETYRDITIQIGRAMIMWIADQWRDYEVVDASGGEKLERWGSYLLIRPESPDHLEYAEGQPGLEESQRPLPPQQKGRRPVGVLRLPQQWISATGS